MTSINDIHIRTELKPGDLGYVAYLHGRLYAEELGYGLNFEGYVFGGLEEFAHQYERTKDKVWVCEHAGKMIGFLMAFHREDNMQLRYFILEQGYRGLGLGKVLMNEFVAFMKEKGCRKAYLWTTEEQHAAIALYSRYGFTLTEEKPSNAFDKELIERKYEMEL